MSSSFHYLWVLPTWGAVASVYFIAADVYLWRKAGVNMWRVWWETRTDNLKTERRFAVEIRKFPAWHFGYQVVKWGTLLVVVSYLALVFIFLIRR
jgi:hypothetical protein